MGNAERSKSKWTAIIVSTVFRYRGTSIPVCVEILGNRLRKWTIKKNWSTFRPESIYSVSAIFESTFTLFLYLIGCDGGRTGRWNSVSIPWSAFRCLNQNIETNDKRRRRSLTEKWWTVKSLDCRLRLSTPEKVSTMNNTRKERVENQ